MGQGVSAIRRSAVALAMGGLLVAGCLGRAQGFEAHGAHWTAELSDRTGAVAAIQVLDEAPAGRDQPAEGVLIRNAAPNVVELSWLGGACLEAARFSLAGARGDGLDLRYDLGPPCEEPVAQGYAFQIRFLRPVDAASLTAVPSWGP